MKCYSYLFTTILLILSLGPLPAQCTGPVSNPLGVNYINPPIGLKASQSFTVPTAGCSAGRFSQLSIMTATNNSQVTLTICPGEPTDSDFSRSDCYTQIGISWQVSMLTSTTINLNSSDPALAFSPGDVFTFTLESESPLNLSRNDIDLFESPVQADVYPDGAYYDAEDQLVAGVDLVFSVSSSSVLPVTWAGFTAEVTPRGNLLRWRTAEESDNYGFFIEFSPDGRDWQEIGFVTASATAGRGGRYEYLDERMTGGWTWYRLRQQDFDGTTDYSPIVRLRGIKTTPVRIYPNPVRAGQAIFLDSAEAVNRIELLGPDGRLYWSADPTGAANPLQVPAGLAPGVYLLQLQSEAGVSTQRLVVR